MRNAKLLKINCYIDNNDLDNKNCDYEIVACVDDLNKGYEAVVKEAYTNWTIDNNVPFDKNQFALALKDSTYTYIGDIKLDTWLDIWTDFWIIMLKKPKKNNIV